MYITAGYHIFITHKTSQTPLNPEVWKMKKKSLEIWVANLDIYVKAPKYKNCNTDIVTVLNK